MRATTPPSRLLQGNHACALGAISAGCRFFAGYPITPSSEIAEWMAQELPLVDGVFIQMEDEIASICAVLGASLGGVKAMTATSGPGFSLKQENLGFAAGAEIPCVVVNVMRGGPGTGLPTRPSQADVMQARWGTHGDHPIIVSTPCSVREIFDETVRAFNLAETYRVPVVLLYDEVIGHLRETVEIPDPASLSIAVRKKASGAKKNYRPYAPGRNGVPAMACPGDGYRAHLTGLTHSEDGFPSQEPVEVERMMRRLLDKLERNRRDIDSFEVVRGGDAEVLVVAYGITARAAMRAVQTLRRNGVKAGLFRPITLWPFPEKAFLKTAKQARKVLVPEMNAGQLKLEIERAFRGRGEVAGLNRIDGEPISPQQIADKIDEMTRNGKSRRR